MHYHRTHRSPPPPPPPPPLPPEVIEASEAFGMPRCYFCGRAITREVDVQKTKYHVGHGQQIMVMICPTCKREGKDTVERGKQLLLGAFGMVVFLAFAAFAFYQFNKFGEDSEREFKQFQQDSDKRHQEFRKRNGFADD